MTLAQDKIYLTTAGKSLTATLADNEATRTLISLLSSHPITIDMEDYGGFEKVGALPQSLPTSNRQITTAPGDIMLYQGRNLVIFYDSNSWSYTPLGKIDADSGTIHEFLGYGNITLTISLSPLSGIENVPAGSLSNRVIYDLKGNLITDQSVIPGVYIINGKKTIVTK